MMLSRLDPVNDLLRDHISTYDVPFVATTRTLEAKSGLTLCLFNFNWMVFLYLDRALPASSWLHCITEQNYHLLVGDVFLNWLIHNGS